MHRFLPRGFQQRWMVRSLQWGKSFVYNKRNACKLATGSGKDISYLFELPASSLLYAFLFSAGLGSQPAHMATGKEALSVF